MVTEAYDVPAATTEIFHDVVADERLKLPSAVVAAADNVSFEGAALPYLCVPFKFTEAISALKGLEAAFASAIAKERYGVDAGEARINTDHAALFVFSAFSTTINGMTALDPRLKQVIKDWDIKDSGKNWYRRLCTSVYRTKDGRYFHLHGSMYARPSMDMVGLDYDDAEKVKLTDREEIVPFYVDAVGKWDSKEIDRTANDEYKQAGTICYSFDEFKQLEAGKAIIDAPVYELYKTADAQPVAWPPAPSGPKKALSGIKVVELTRVIAGPSICNGLAEHGATVLRIVTSTQPDLHVIHPDLNQGKYVAELNLKTEEGKETLRRLIKDADVIVEGYRPGAVERLGFGREAVRKINPNIVYVRENCYGFHGPWQGRSGWQQIADCFTGLSYGFGEKLGLKDGESVVPIFPNSDFGAGASGLLGTMNALYRRATEGGVYNVDVALSYYDVWLMRLGYYPDSVWEQIRPTAKLRHHWEMYTMLPAVLPEMLQRRPDVFTSPKYWHELDAPSYGEGAKVRTTRPIVKFDSGVIEVGVARGPVQNGDDPAEWPSA